MISLKQIYLDWICGWADVWLAFTYWWRINLRDEHLATVVMTEKGTLNYRTRSATLFDLCRGFQFIIPLSDDLEGGVTLWL